MKKCKLSFFTIIFFAAVSSSATAEEVLSSTVWAKLNEDKSGSSLLSQVLTRSTSLNASLLNVAYNAANLSASLSVLHDQAIDLLLEEFTADSATIKFSPQFFECLNAINSGKPDFRCGDFLPFDGGIILGEGSYPSLKAVFGLAETVIMGESAASIQMYDPRFIAEALLNHHEILETMIVGALNTGVIGLNRGDIIDTHTYELPNVSFYSLSQTAEAHSSTWLANAPRDQQFVDAAVNSAALADAQITIRKVLADVHSVKTVVIGAINTGYVPTNVRLNVYNLRSESPSKFRNEKSARSNN